MKRTINWLPNIVMLLYGVVFLIASLSIEAESDSGGARAVPMAMSIMVITLVLMQIFIDFKSKSPADNKNAEPENPIFLRMFLSYCGLLILIMVAYGLCLGWFGYLISTALAAVLVFYLFGNSLPRVLIHSCVGTVLFYILFVKVMGIYDPPGSIIDISNLFIPTD